MNMSNQAENETQQVETIATEEVRQFLLAELEASKQALVELSNEQLGEIAGGFLPSREQFYNRMVTATCCLMGAGLGYLAGKTFGNGSGKGELLGTGIGFRTGMEVAKNFHVDIPRSNAPHSPRSPRGDQEAGTSREQNYGTFN